MNDSSNRPKALPRAWCGAILLACFVIACLAFFSNTTLAQPRLDGVFFSDSSTKHDPRPKVNIADNEINCYFTLRSLHSAEIIFKERAYKDEDVDDVGEYAVLADSGVANGDLVAAGQIAMTSSGAGVCEKGGYLFIAFLPGTSDDDDEESFCITACPKKWGKTGRKAFFINEMGRVYECDNADGKIGNGMKNLVTVAEVYGTAFDNSTIIAKTWKIFSAKKLLNEKSCRAILKVIHNAETIFKEKAYKDGDGDGVGEYAVLADSGVANGDLVNAGQIALTSNGAGIAEKGGYLFMVYLPGTSDDDDEESFCAVAWPHYSGKTGTKAFFMNETGTIYECSNSKGQIGDNAADPVTIAEIYGTAFDNSTIDKKTWRKVKRDTSSRPHVIEHKGSKK